MKGRQNWDVICIILFLRIKSFGEYNYCYCYFNESKRCVNGLIYDIL